MTDWAKLKVVDLKTELKRRDLPQHGLKAELVARLDEADAATEPAADETPAVEEDKSESEPQIDDGAAETNAAPPAIPVPETTTKIADFKEIGSVMEDAAETTQTTNAGSLPPTELPSDESQKRKRKSATPSPDAEEIAAKRARSIPEQDTKQSEPVVSAPVSEEQPVVMLVEEPPPADEPAVAAPADVEQTLPPLSSNKLPAEKPYLPPLSPSPPPKHPAETAAHISASETNNEMDVDMMDVDHDVAPAAHPATSALYISNLMRPLRPADVQAHVCALASGDASGQASDESVIVQFHLDQIRTHAFVVLSSVRAATRVRALLHDRVWPDESNRKALSVDFVPPDKITDWIDMETGNNSSGGGRPGRSTARWEVIYTTGPDGIVEAHFKQVGGGGGGGSRPSFPPPPTGPASQAGNNTTIDAPTGPRGNRPREDNTSNPQSRQQSQLALPPPPGDLDYELRRTRARPTITFQRVAPMLARQRVENMRAFYTVDSRRPLGRDFNRYSFERGGGFVDRGKEVFEGIRPPHRERGGGGGGRGRGGGGSGGRVGGKFGGRGAGGGGGGGGGGRRFDRYLPGGSAGGRRRDDDWARDRGRDRRY